MKEKTNQSNTSQKSATKSRISGPKDDDFIYSFRRFPASEAFVRRLTQDLYQWFRRNPMAKSIRKFFDERRIASSTYYDLVKREEHLREVHEFVMLQLGEGLWENAVDRKTDWAATKWRLSKYSKEFADLEKHHVDLVAQAKGENTNVVTEFRVVGVKDPLADDKR